MVIEGYRSTGNASNGRSFTQYSYNPSDGSNYTNEWTNDSLRSMVMDDGFTNGVMGYTTGVTGARSHNASVHRTSRLDLIPELVREDAVLSLLFPSSNRIFFGKHNRRAVQSYTACRVHSR
ncbi:hypothetical protein F5B21DRAFT_478655 [Xylaria acuta]|nr:hypothetical protein F5B21DRAFT_478655 [Xylaria acuta]